MKQSSYAVESSPVKRARTEITASSGGDSTTRRVMETPTTIPKTKTRHHSMYNLQPARSKTLNVGPDKQDIGKKLSDFTDQTDVASSAKNSRILDALTYLPTIVAKNIEARTKEGKTPIRTLGEYGHEEFNGACAFFDISGFSKLASRLGKREKEESKKRRQTTTASRISLDSQKHVRGNSLLGKKSHINLKGLMMTHAETVAKQHEESLKLLPRILSERRGMGAETLA